jgi:predicted ArsR family transcriptional regulator
MKMEFHPKAFLSNKRNVKLGLIARTRILSELEKSPAKAKEIADTSKLSYKTVLYHLHLLEVEKVTTRSGNRPYVWQLTGVGQQRLSNTTSR